MFRRLLFKSSRSETRLKTSAAAAGNRGKYHRRTAGVIVIGDEVLKGQVHDTNSHFIVKRMYELGVKVDKITVIGDVHDVIAKEVKAFSKKYTYVITTGGIGPTHDDITFQSVATAFNEPLVPHPELVNLISNYYKTEDLSSPPMKMAHIPKSAGLHYGTDKTTGRKTLFPNVNIRNVYMFPGIPQLMEKLFDLVWEDLFGGESRHFCMKELYVTAGEAEIANVLNGIVAEFPKVTFGSYPKLYHSYYKVLITVESENEEETNEAYNKLRNSLLKDVIEYDKDPLAKAYQKLLKIMNSNNNSALQKALEITEECVQKYSQEKISVFLDGSIESICALHIYYAVHVHKDAPSQIHAVRIKSSHCKQEMEEFVNKTIFRYNITCETLECDKNSFTALSTYLPQTKVIIFGNLTRQLLHQRNDCLKLLEENTLISNIKWLTPLIDWNSDDVWKFVRTLSLPYCGIYDKGYRFSTSGSTNALFEAIAEMNKVSGQPSLNAK